MSSTLSFFANLYPGQLPGKIEFRRLPNSGAPDTETEKHRFFTTSPDDIRWVGENWALDVPYGVFYGVALRKLDATRGTKGDIAAITALWADVDVKKLGWDMTLTLGAIKAHPLRPSAVVNSGNGYHLYWALKTPLLATDPSWPDNVLRAETVMRKLGEVFAGDAVQDITRVLRVPGTLNTKGSTQLVKVVLEDWNEYSLDELVGVTRDGLPLLLDNGKWVSREAVRERAKAIKEAKSVFLGGGASAPLDRGSAMSEDQIWKMTKVGGGHGLLGIDEAILRVTAKLAAQGYGDDWIIDRVLEKVKKIHHRDTPHDFWSWPSERREIADKLARYREKNQ